MSTVAIEFPRRAGDRTPDQQTVAVLIMCRDEAHSVRDVIAAIRGQNGAPDSCRILLASNKPGDGTNEVLSTYGYRKLFLDENYFISSLRNAATAVCDEDILIFVDGHMVLEPDSLKYFVEGFRSPDVAAVFGYYSAPGTGLPWYEYIRDARYHAKSGKAELTEPRTYGRTGFLLPTGGIFAVRRSALIRAGGFDTRFDGACFEDVMLAIRLVNDDYRIVYDPRIRASHVHHHSSPRSLVRRAYGAEPRGMTRLLSLSAAEGLHVPYDGYGLSLPIGLLTCLVGAVVLPAPFGYAAGAAAAVVVARDVRPILELDPARFPLRVRLATVGYWYLVGASRLVYAAAALRPRRRPLPQRTSVTGVLEDQGRREQVTIEVPLHPERSGDARGYVWRLLRTYGRLGLPTLDRARRRLAATLRGTAGSA